MRRGFTIVQLLIVMMTVPLMALLLDRVFSDLAVDLPRSVDMMEQNGVLLRMIPVLQRDIGQARDLRRAERDLMIQTPQGVVVYRFEPGRIVRRQMDSPDPNEQVWSAPQASVDWSILSEDGRPYALQVRTCVTHRRSRQEKMKNTFVLVLGSDRGREVADATRP